MALLQESMDSLKTSLTSEYMLSSPIGAPSGALNNNKYYMSAFENVQTESSYFLTTQGGGNDSVAVISGAGGAGEVGTLSQANIERVESIMPYFILFFYFYFEFYN